MAYNNLTTIYARNVTMLTKLSNCLFPLNITQTEQDLFDNYNNNASGFSVNNSLFVSIPRYDCYSPTNRYFEQIVSFAHAVSIRVQVALAASLFEFIVNRTYSLHGFETGRELTISLSSITVNYTTKLDACASGETALDPLCARFSLTPTCIEPTVNPWIYNCTHQTTLSTNRTNYSAVTAATISSVIPEWLIAVFSACALILLILLIFIIFYARRRSKVTRITDLQEEYNREVKSEEKKGIPTGTSFQNTKTIVETRRVDSKTIPAVPMKSSPANRNKPVVQNLNTKTSTNPTKGTFVNYSKRTDGKVTVKKITNILPATQKITQPETSNSPNLKATPMTNTSRPVSGTSISQLRTMIDGIEEQSLDGSDNISLTRSITPTTKKPGTPVSRQFINGSFVEESLHDEDAWVPILAFANAQLAVLKRTEGVQNRTKP